MLTMYQHEDAMFASIRYFGFRLVDTPVVNPSRSGQQLHCSDT